MSGTAWHSLVPMGLLALSAGLSGCMETDFVVPGALRINEVMTSNDGAWLDSHGETDDWVELVNQSQELVWLDDYLVGDRRNKRVRLPPIPIPAGQRLVLFADDEPTQGELHVPFKLSAEGETLFLRERSGQLIDYAELPTLAPNESFVRIPESTDSFTVCRYATPLRTNGEHCGPVPPPELPDEPFAPFSWPDPWPAPPAVLALSELALRPATFVELRNVSDSVVALSDVSVRLAPHAPGLPWPGPEDGVELVPPESDVELAPGDYFALEVTEADLAAIAAKDEYEGVVGVFDRHDGSTLDRVDFMRWPEHAVLTRGETGGPFRFCAAATPAAENDECDPLASRDVGDRVRYLRTPGDFAALSAGTADIGLQAVKFVIDMEAGDVVHLLGASWDLHYTFVREAIEHEEHLDRCDPEQNASFHLGWTQFSREQYFEIETRRYLLGTMVDYAGPNGGLHTLEFVTGDQITGEQMRRAFFDVAAQTTTPIEWAVRPQDAAQDDKLRPLERTLPIVSRNAPYRDLEFQPLTSAIGYGTLRFVPVGELDTEPLGPDAIVITDDVPNDIPLVGGLITEALQTPLAHVNVLSQGRDTPNMALRDARNDPRVAPFLGKLVRLAVHGNRFELTEADPAEAEEFWASRRPTGERRSPQLDLEVRGIQLLENLGIDDLAAIGAKAAQLAELGNVQSDRAQCAGSLPVPSSAMAIPVVHYVEHFEASGAAAELSDWMTRADFRTDPTVRAEGLSLVRQRILEHPVDSELQSELTAAIEQHFGSARVRFRSSSNIEDLTDFNGAGLYTSLSAAVGDPDRPIPDALRTVWASLWRPRAYDEREYANIDQSGVAMGVLIHQAFLSERANGVAVTRNLLDPNEENVYYFNAQAGEAMVTNPAPGTTSEELLYRWGRTSPIVRHGRSSLVSHDVLTASEVADVACSLAAIEAHFRPLLDPDGSQPWFAMEIEFKLLADNRSLIIKQTRPYSFGRAEPPASCR